MLTNSSTFILGVITERPTNPYEITKYGEYVGIHNWLNFPAQSIYSAIKMLLKKGFIVGRSVKDGNMPDKTVYSITETGEKEFLNTLEEYLGNTEWDFAKFNIATIFICHLSKEKVYQILDKKLEYLTDKKKALEESICRLESLNYPATGIHAVRHMCLLTDSDIQSTMILKTTVDKDNKWNHFLAADIAEKMKGKK